MFYTLAAFAVDARLRSRDAAYTASMSLMTAYGFVSVALMLVFYAMEDRSHWFVLLFAGACLMSSIYGVCSKAPGHSEPWKASGPSSPCTAGSAFEPP